MQYGKGNNYYDHIHLLCNYFSLGVSIGKISLFIYHMVFILLYFCSVLDHRGHQNVVRTAVQSHSNMESIDFT